MGDATEAEGLDSTPFASQRPPRPGDCSTGLFDCVNMRDSGHRLPVVTASSNTAPRVIAEPRSRDLRRRRGAFVEEEERAELRELGLQ